MKYNIILLYIFIILIILIIFIYLTNRLNNKEKVDGSGEKSASLPLISIPETSPLTYRRPQNHEDDAIASLTYRRPQSQGDDIAPLTYRQQRTHEEDNGYDYIEPLTYRSQGIHFNGKDGNEFEGFATLTYPDNIDYSESINYNVESLNYPTDKFSLEFSKLSENIDNPELLTSRAPIKIYAKANANSNLNNIFNQVQTSYSSYLLSKKSYFNSRKKFKESYLVTNDRVKRNNIFKEALDEAHDSSLFANETYRNCNKVFDMILKLPTEKDMIDAKIYFDNATEYSNKVKKYADFSHKILSN